jgi:signal transduction histidine kinase
MDQHPWRLGARGRWWFDASLTLGLLVPGVVGHLVAGQPLASLLTAAQVAPLWWRRTHPSVVFAVVAAASAAQAPLHHLPIVGQLAFPIATYSVARWSPRWHGLVALIVGYVGAVVAAWSWIGGFGAATITLDAVTPYLVTIAAIVTAAWALGFAAQQRERYVAGLVERAEQAERMAEREIELAAQDERSRIAREMHDVVAHGLSVIVVQADGARYAAAKDPDVAVATLETIGATGRESLTEMRRLLGLLRTGDTGVRPVPGLGDLPYLVEETRAAGTSIEADLPDPVPEVPEGVGLAAYRIVQEALTNVRKHAGPGATVRLRVRIGPTLDLEVHDDGRGAAATTDGRGLGQVGMRERASVHGGTLRAGPAAGGGYTVSATMPLRTASRGQAR